MPYLPVVRPANTPVWTRDLDLPPKGWELRTLNEYLDGKPPRHAGLPPFGRTVAMWRTHFQHLVQEARHAESPTRFLLGSLHGWHDGYTGAEPRADASLTAGRMYGSAMFEAFRYNTRLIPPNPLLWNHDPRLCLTCAPFGSPGLSTG